MDIDEHIHKGHNKSLLSYHFVCPIKYRRKVLGDVVSETFKKICMQIEERYEIHFLEIGLDWDYLHFLVQSVPVNAPKKIIAALKNITAKEIFRLHPEVEQMPRGGRFWASGYYVNTVGQYADEEVIKKYFQNQGRKNYVQLHRNRLKLFGYPDGSASG